MEKDISCLNFKGLFAYIERTYGRAALQRMVDTALAGKDWTIANKHDPGRREPVTLSHLTDESYWISNALSLALLAGIKTVVPGPSPEQDAGREAVLTALSRRDLFFCRLIGPKALARRVARVNSRFNRTKTVSMVRLDKKGGNFILDYAPGICVTKDVCNWNLGIYEGLARVSGARKVRVTEVKCVTAGDPHCEFRVDWQAPGLVRRMATHVLSFFTHELAADYERLLEDRDLLIERLQASENLFRLMADNTSALVSVHGADTRYLFASPSHQRLGYDPDALVGRSAFAMVDTSDAGRLSRQLERIRSDKISCAVIDYRLKDRSGRVLDFRGTVDAVKDEAGRVRRFICVGEDITALKQAQEQREEALALAAENRKLALVGQVAGKMAHDFNNILGSILGNAELSLMDCEEEGVREAFQIIVDQSIRGKNLTRNLVAFARDQELKQEYFRIDEKIDRVLGLLGDELRQVRVVRECGEDLPDLLADPAMIEHALVNILQNAIHATGLADHPEIVISTDLREDRICIRVRDNGCGIPPGCMDQIFDPSFTLKGTRDLSGAYPQGVRGTGYGLANVKKYIEQHRGTLTLTSDEGRGTMVHIALPVQEKELTARERAIAGQREWIRERSVLLVEDERDIRDAQYRVLSHFPCCHRVDAAGDSETAMALFDQNDYDLVSLDYLLPGRHSGMDIYRYIRSRNQDVPVLFISGNLEFIASIKDLKQQDPRVEHISKPCRNMKYLKSVNRLLGCCGPA